MQKPKGPGIGGRVMDAKEAELKAENKKLLAAARAYQDLSVCYRIGKRPTEKLFSQLDRANALLKQREEE